MNEKIVDASNQRQRERAAEMQKNTSGMRTAACGMRTAACGICRSDWHGWMGNDPDIRLPHEETAAHRTPGGFSTQLSDVGRGNLERWYSRDLAFVQLCRELAPSVNSPG